MTRPFATSEDRPATREELAPGVFAFTAQGDPNVGAIVGPDSVACVDARATPAAARTWINALREVTDKPVEYLFLTHYHAVRTLGAAAFRARHVVAHEATARWIEERGQADFESELGRFPRLFPDADAIPGLTHPDVTFDDRLTLMLGDREIQLRWVGPGHTSGDLVVWMPAEGVLFAGDLVENEATPYAGDAAIGAWSSRTLAAVGEIGAAVLVPGRGTAVWGDRVTAAIDSTRGYLSTLWTSVRAVHEAHGTLAQAVESARAALQPDFGDWFIFEHCLPFNVARAFEEAAGAAPAIWTAEKDVALRSLLRSSPNLRL